MDDNIVRLHNGELRNCDQCGAEHTVSMTYENEKFIYGAGKDAAELTARIPVWTCQACGEGYTDKAAETIRHSTVCAHLGVLTPEQIKKIRTDKGLSQAEFARIIGVGEASLKRWETGALIQNIASDRYLRLLADDAIFDKVAKMTDGSTPYFRPAMKYRIPFTQEIVAASYSFQLSRRH